MAREEPHPQATSGSFFSLPAAILSRRWVLPCLLVLATGYCYWESLYTFFAHDDFCILTLVQKPMPNMDMLRGNCLFRPLSAYWLPWLNVFLWGLNPFFHHLTYLALFLTTVAILYVWLQETTSSVAAALVGASLYAFSKTHLYTLAWIAGGSDILTGFFLVLTLWTIARYFRQSAANGGLVDNKHLALVGVLLWCALLCKESCVVIAPACLAWIATHKFIGRRRLYPAEWKLAAMVIGLTIIYLCLWKLLALVGDATMSQFDLWRGVTVLKDSVIAVVPFAESSLPRSNKWLMLPLLLTVFVTTDCWRRHRDADHLVFGLSLWVLSASIYVFTSYPFVFQLYHSHNCIFGLSLLMALAVRSLQEQLTAWQERPRSTGWIPTWQTVSAGVAVAMFGAWLILASQTIREGIRHRESPAFYVSDLAKAAYEQLDVNLQSKQYQRVVFLNASGLTWDSMYGTAMTSLYFPDVQVDYSAQDYSEAHDYPHTSATTLVMRLSKDHGLTVVR